jgi:hypothetical protein
LAGVLDGSTAKRAEVDDAYEPTDANKATTRA